MKNKLYRKKNQMKKYLLLFCVFILALSSCKKGDVVSEQAAVDDAKIQAYIKANNITAVKDPSGLYYQIVKQGTGTAPLSTSTIQVNSIGTLINGTEFDHSSVQSYKLSSTIKGWQIGLLHLNGGVAGDTRSYGRIILLIPSALAYGTSTPPGIPANSVLAFTIDLIGYY
jgi:FKBP-type peptidyl-prolyl cis-trans isomerase FkpA